VRRSEPLHCIAPAADQIASTITLVPVINSSGDCGLLVSLLFKTIETGRFTRMFVRTCFRHEIQRRKRLSTGIPGYLIPAGARASLLPVREQ
jgi:hypothetical protein